MLITLLLVVVGLVVLVLLCAALSSSDSNISRSASIKAAPAVLFGQVNDLHQFQAWNPWGKIDPAMTSTFAGPAAGVGASYAWSGNAQVGVGRMTIIESRPNEWVRMKLEFLKPFASASTAEFTFKPEGEQTVITWRMYGKKIFIMKVMSLFMSPDKMVGGAFEKGFADLRKLTEK
jgi:hypothetical protein